MFMRKKWMTFMGMLAMAVCLVSCERAENTVQEKETAKIQQETVSEEKAADSQKEQKETLQDLKQKKAEAAVQDETDEPKYILPMAGLVLTDTLKDGEYAAAFESEDLVITEEEMTLTVVIFSYDRYVPEDIFEMKEKDTVQIAGQDILAKEVGIFTSPVSGESDILLNGGMEQGGYDFRCYADGDMLYYRIVRENDFPLYQSIGSITLPFAEEAVFVDYCMDNEGAEVSLTELKAHLEETQPYVCSELNTQITVTDGVITGILRRYTP